MSNYFTSQHYNVMPIIEEDQVSRLNLLEHYMKYARIRVNKSRILAYFMQCKYEMNWNEPLTCFDKWKTVPNKLADACFYFVAIKQKQFFSNQAPYNTSRWLTTSVIGEIYWP